MSKVEVKKIIKKYAKKLEAEKYPFSAIYLFGSYVKGKPNKWSDIDVAVVSNKLKKDWNRNEDKLWKYAFRVDSRIEPLGFTPKDFKEGADPMICDIKRFGERVV